jgi:hypothetical protein
MEKDTKATSDSLVDKSNKQNNVMSSGAAYHRNRNETLPAIIGAVAVTMFLFYIDEGYYDFRWMQQPGNWIAFIMYFLPMFVCQWLAAHFLFRRENIIDRTVKSFLIGVPVAIALVVGFFYWWMR